MANLAQLTVKIGADLTDLNRGLRDAGQGVQRLGQQVSGNLTAPIRQSTSEMTRNAGAVTRSATAWKSLREPLTSATRSLLQLNPAVSQVSSVLGTMAIGTGPMIGILAGIAAIAAGWSLLTKEARETEKANKDAIKALKEARDQQKLGSSAGTMAREAEKAGTDLALNLEAQRKLIPRVAGSASRTIGVDPVLLGKLVKLQKEETELRDALQVHEIKLGEVRAKNAAEASAQNTKQIADLKAMNDELFKAQTLLADLYSPNVSDLKLAGSGVPLPRLTPSGGAKIGPEVFAEVQAVGMRAAAALVQAAAELKAAAQVQQSAALKQYAIQQGLGLLNQHGGAIGGILSGAISGGMAAGPWGAAIGAGSALIGTLLSQRKSTDANTAALHRLTEAIYGEPTGFKANNYRYQVTDPASTMRWLNGAADVFASRGGVVTYG